MAQIQLMQSVLRYLLFSVALLYITGLPAQQTVHECGSDVLLEQQLKTPGQQSKLDAYEELLYRLVNSPSTARETEYTIPVVVHIIHGGGPENISDATVIQGIRDLNDAFANAGFYAQEDGVDVPIRFCLAKQDENGLFTTGINRVLSPLTNMTLETQDQQLKNLIRWNTNHYLNIWLVASISSLSVGPNVAGYATFPTSAGSGTDGIVNEARFFGSTPDNSKIHIHEVGHYLGLYHTFQNGCTNNNCLLDGDRVCDTPPDNSVQAVNCNATFNSCTTDENDPSVNNPFRSVALGGLGDQNDLFQNYMDYGYQPCQNLFTQGQSGRMILSLVTMRSSLLESNGCNSPCPSPVTAGFVPSANPVPAGTPVNFTNTSTGATIYAWYRNGVPFSTAQNPSQNFSPQGTYYITLEVSNGDSSCYATHRDTLIVTCPVNSSFTASATHIPQGSSITFTRTSTGATTYEWLLGSTSVGTSPVLTRTFPAQGSFYITLRSSNGFCSVVSESILIVVGPSCNGVAAGPDISVCRGDTVRLFTDTSAIARHDSLVWLGGNGTFIPNRHVPNPAYIPSAAEQASGVADLLLKVIVQGSVSNPATNLLAYDHTNQDSVFYISPIDGAITGVQSNSGRDWTAMGYRLADNILYGISNIVYPPALYSMNLATNAVTQIAPYNMDFFAGDYDHVHDIFYGIGISTSTSSTGFAQTLYKINTTDGSLTTVGNIGVTGINGNFWALGDGLNGLAYEPAGDVLYGVSYSGKLYSISTTTGVATFIANTQPNLRGLTFDYTTNKLWGVNTKSDLFEIDRTSGVVLSTVLSRGNFANVTSLTFAPGEHVLNTSIVCHDSLRITINPLPQVSLGPDTSICGTEPVLLDAGSGFAEITWQDGSHQNPFAASQAGLYWVKVTDTSGCTHSDTVQVLGSFGVPSLNLGPDTVLCPGGIITLQAPQGYKQYRWHDLTGEETNTVFGPGKYWVTVSDACGGTSTDTIRIDPALNVHPALGPDTNLCGEQTLILDAGPGFTSYRWQDNQATQQILVSSAGTYYIRVESSNGCMGFDTIQVNYLPGSTVVDLGPDRVLCEDSTVTLDAGNGFLQYLWQDGSGDESFETADTGIYSVRAKGTNGCWGGDSVQVLPNQEPEPDLGNDTTTCNAITLHAGAQFLSYLWSTGETTESILAENTGTYWVIVQDAALCSKEASINIDVNSAGGEVNIPNVFSPNSDLVNDLLEVNTDFVADYSLLIFNRWGQKLFETTNPSDFWPGGDHPEGTYFYVLRYTNECTGSIAEKKGTVTLLR